MKKSMSWLAFLCLAAVLAAAVLSSASAATAAEGGYVAFSGAKQQWHGFDRYDYFMDDATLTIKEATPGNPPAGQRRCTVVVPKTPAAGNPWSWRGCYWDHQPQAEIELLRRGFHVGYVSVNGTSVPGKQWEAWYDFVTKQHGLHKKPAFIGMSRGGSYEYNWGVNHPDKVGCIYADNPGGGQDVIAHLDGLAKADVPILQVNGSIDPIMGRVANVIEALYLQYNARMSVMIKNGDGHHPHSLKDPKPIADFIEKSIAESGKPTTPPEWVAARYTKGYYYNTENQYRDFTKTERNFITCHGANFSECYRALRLRRRLRLRHLRHRPQAGGRRPAVGLPGRFPRPQRPRRQALLAKGVTIVVAPTGTNSDGLTRRGWDIIYQYMTGKGFSKRPIMAGAGGAGGEAYGWAILNADKVSCIYGENPIIRSHMTATPPILDNLAALAKAKVPLVAVCGSLDPWFKTQTQVLAAKYKDLGGTMTVFVKEGEGHYPLPPRTRSRSWTSSWRRGKASSSTTSHRAAGRQSRPAGWGRARTQNGGHSTSGRIVNHRSAGATVDS